MKAFFESQTREGEPLGTENYLSGIEEGEREGEEEKKFFKPPPVPLRGLTSLNSSGE